MNKILFALILTETIKNGNAIKKLKTQLDKIMADSQAALDKVNELSGKVDSMQAIIDQEQADIAALVATNAQVVLDLTAQRDALQAIIDAGGTGDTQPIIDAINGVIAKVDAASADVSTTV